MTRKVLLGLLLCVVVVGGVWGVRWATRPSVQEVLADFHAAEGRAEDMLMDPLILNADLVAPAIVMGIKDPDMDKRRYAVAFLGIADIRDALPVLRTILADATEKSTMRGDALESTYRMEREAGLVLARKYTDQDGHLGHVARGLTEGSWRLRTRTYWQALVGYHE